MKPQFPPEQGKSGQLGPNYKCSGHLMSETLGCLEIPPKKGTFRAIGARKHYTIYIPMGYLMSETV